MKTVGQASRSPSALASISGAGRRRNRPAPRAGDLALLISSGETELNPPGTLRVTPISTTSTPALKVGRARSGGKAAPPFDGGGRPPQVFSSDSVSGAASTARRRVQKPAGPPRRSPRRRLDGRVNRLLDAQQVEIIRRDLARGPREPATTASRRGVDRQKFRREGRAWGGPTSIAVRAPHSKSRAGRSRRRAPAGSSAARAVDKRGSPRAIRSSRGGQLDRYRRPRLREHCQGPERASTRSNRRGGSTGGRASRRARAVGHDQEAERLLPQKVARQREHLGRGLVENRRVGLSASSSSGSAASAAECHPAAAGRRNADRPSAAAKAEPLDESLTPCRVRAAGDWR